MTEAAGYCDLEVGLDDGRRGSRFVWLRPLVAAVIGSEDAHVVNNNAAALLLACTVLGDPGGVVLSRGQMVEIGDSFRVATMAAAGGCRVVAVGSTNRTHRSDYEDALAGDGAASAILWVHQSWPRSRARSGSRSSPISAADRSASACPSASRRSPRISSRAPTWCWPAATSSSAVRRAA
jgi:L-seryl-tRNA(Ser) seleniumtransferase